MANELVGFPVRALALRGAVPSQAAPRAVAQLGGLPAVVARIAAEHGPELAAHLLVVCFGLEKVSMERIVSDVR